MKYLVPSERANKIEGLGYNVLFGVDVERKSLHAAYQWGKGWIFDADESFNLFCVIMFGWEPIIITDEEFTRLLGEGVVFFEKHRGKKIHNAFKALIPKRRDK